MKVADNPGFESGLRGWKHGPKLEQGDAECSWRFEAGDVGIVVAVWSAPPGTSCFCATQWHCILVTGKGYAWYPLGWVLTADSTPWKEWKQYCDERNRLHNVSYRGFCD